MIGNITNLFLIGLISYFVILLVVANLARRRAQPTIEDYFLASRSVGSVVMFWGYIASIFSVFVIAGVFGLVFLYGVGGYMYGVMNVWAGLLIIYLAYRMWLAGRAFGHITPGDMLEHRYQSRLLRWIMAIFVLVFGGLYYIAIQMIGMGYIFEVAGLPYQLGIVATMVILVTYLLIGGFRAHVWTNVIQGIWFYGILIAGMFFLISGAGGWEKVVINLENLSPRHLTIMGAAVLFWVTTVISLGSDIVAPHLWPKFLAPKNPVIFKVMAVTLPVAMSLVYIPSLIGGISAISFFNVQLPQGVRPDQLFYAGLTRIEVPVVFLMLALLALPAAAMSTIEAFIMTCSSVVVVDVFKKGLKVNWSEKSLLNVGRIVIGVLGLGSLWFAYNPGQVIGVLVTAGWGLYSVLVPAALCAFYWRRATKWGAISSILVGIVLILLGYTVLTPLWPPGFQPFTVGLLVSWATFFIVSRFTKPPSKEVIDTYMQIGYRARVPKIIPPTLIGVSPQTNDERGEKKDGN
ncbi:MAG: sodium:solute symporter family protein [Aigarchaeota archaeon]|nr:sodium:solute symporter family protein [Aigarchaeota archaeon]MDW8092793.1 sodium:solute symporter family protein [Nitrososphaerota archaeon]